MVDYLTGGLGSDVLIGGDGDDILQGGNRDDLLIGGFTMFDGNLPALEAILREWSSNNLYDLRVGNLRQGFGAVQGTGVRLVPSGANQTVFDDGAKDDFKGGDDRDWFFANLDRNDKDRDKVSDQRSDELVDLL